MKLTLFSWPLSFFFLIVLLFSQVCFAATTVTLQAKRPNHSILMRDRKNFLEFRPNASLHWGVKISGDAFYIEYGAKIADTNYGNSEVGNNSYKSYRLGIPIKNWFIGAYYQEWQGFSSDENSENGCDYCLDRENLTSRETSLNLLYAFDDSFSMKALNSNGSQGVSLSSSWLMMAYYDRYKIRDFGGLLQGDSNREFPFFADKHTIDARQTGLGVGYGFLAPLGPLYFGLSGIIGFGYQDNKNFAIDGSEGGNTGMGNHWNVKIKLGTHGPGLNFGLKGYLFSNIYKVSDNNNLASLNYNIYLYTSYSF